MKILIPTHAFTDDPKSGLHTVIWNTSKQLALLGHKVYVVTTYLDLVNESKLSLHKKGIRVYKISNHKTHNLGYPESFFIFLFTLILRIINKFDWIYVIDTSITPFSKFKLGAKLACRVLRSETEEVNRIINSDDWEYDRHRKDQEEHFSSKHDSFGYRLIRFFSINIWFKIFPVKTIGENADILFCQGQDTLNYYRSIGFKNLFNLPNGIENDLFDSVNEGFLNINNFTYLFVGRIVRRKGIFYLLEAFSHLSQKYPDIKLWVIGKGSKELEDKFRLDAKELIDNGKLKIFGEKSHKEIVKFIKSCNVVVDPMIYAGFSTVVLEALYCKKPIIAPKFGGSKEVIIDGQNGFLVDSRDVNTLKNKMEYYYLNQEITHKMALSGYEVVRTKFTWTQVIRFIDKLFNQYK